MKNFKFDLNAKVAIYVPSTTDVNQPCDNKVVVNKVMTAIFPDLTNKGGTKLKIYYHDIL